MQSLGEAPPKLSTPNNLPLSNVSAFVGREGDLKAVDALLRDNSRVNIAAAVGMGGVGKTELALQYALRRGDAFADGVCWLRGVEPIAPQMVSFAQDYLNLTVPEQTENPVAWCVQRWPRAGERAGEVLLIVDDVQDYGALKRMLPSPAAGDGRFRVLLTARQKILPVGQRLSLEVLMPKAAVALLTSLMDAARIEAEPDEAIALCERVGRLPLGIELVGWYLAEQRPDWKIAKLLERLEEKKLAARALQAAHPEMTAELGVAAAFEVSWEPLSGEAKILAGLLGLFAAAPVQWDWVERARERAAVVGFDEDALADGQAALRKVNLLEKAQEKGETGKQRYGVHPLVREFFAVKRGELAAAAALQQGFAQAMTEVAKKIPRTVTVAVRSRVADAAAHMEEVAQRWTSELEGFDKTRCCIGLGRFYESLSQWEETERWWQKALEISKADLGDDHPVTASSLNILALLYRSQSRYSEAEPLLLEALAIRKEKLGKRHTDTAKSLNGLALLYRSQGRYSEAESLHVEALSIRRAELGERHIDTVTSLNNLAGLYRIQERYSEAESLYVEALAIKRAELGEHHPSTARGLNNLASLYQSQGRDSEAESLYVEALAIKRAELGEHHPSTARGLNNLASLYQSQGRDSEAEPLYVEALAIRESELGDRHPDTATSLNNLAGLYDAQGRYSEAEPLLEQALAIRKAELGDRHPDTARSLNNLAMLYFNTNRLAQAAAAMSGVVAIFEDRLSPNHPNTRTAKANLAAIQQASKSKP